MLYQYCPYISKSELFKQSWIHLNRMNASENMSQANKQDMENKGRPALGGKERPVCVPRASSSCFRSILCLMKWRLWLGISLSLPETTEWQNLWGVINEWSQGEKGRRKVVAKPGRNQRQSDPSGPDKAEWKTDECGEADGGVGGWDGAEEWICLGGYTA